MDDKQEKQEFLNPNGWNSGPPETKTESWNWERRNEVASWAQNFLATQVGAAADKPEAWKEQGGFGSLDTDQAVDLAIRLQKSVDSRCPKR